MTRERVLFLLIAAIETFHTAIAILQHRVPTGHDGFQYFTVQYYFLNNAIQAHEIPQWIPYMNQGTIATFWYAIQASILQSVLLFWPSLVRHASLLSVYHAGMFVDEMILLAGTWLLARRFFRTPAVCFIALCVVGSAVWLRQPYWNFRLYYALPLVIELGHCFLETGRWRWGFLSANLLALQALGNLPYFLPVATFVAFAYFCLFAAGNWDATRARLEQLRWGLPAVAALVLGGASFMAVYACMSSGTSQLVSYNPGRLSNGSTTLAGFLAYGGATDARKWLDLLLNESPSVDFTIYAGALVAPLLLCGVIAVDRRRLHFVLLAATMLLFTMGTFVSTGLFYAWPGMKYFRHIGLVTPLVKVLCGFVAGIGFEWLFDPVNPRRAITRCIAGGAFAVCLLYAARMALNLADSAPAAADFVQVRRLASTAMTLRAGAVLICAFPVLQASWSFARSPRGRQVLQLAVLLFVAADVYRFKFDYLFQHSDVIGAPERFVVQPSALDYSTRRVADLREAALAGAFPRLQATLAFSPMLRARVEGRATREAEYWTNNAFFFADEAGSTFRADSWLKPLDEFMRMNWSLPVDGGEGLPAFVDLDRLRFPLDHPPTRRVSGIDADKIRFFTRAYGVNSVNDLPPLLMNPSYAGNVLFVLPLQAPEKTPGPVPWTRQVPLDGDDSRPLAYTVQHFDSNNLLVSVADSGPQQAWMSYADVWHPFWEATVNGRPVPVYRGEMAYKAILLDPGPNIVHFRFRSPALSIVPALVAGDAALWLFLVCWMIMRGVLQS